MVLTDTRMRYVAAAALGVALLMAASSLMAQGDFVAQARAAKARGDVDGAIRVLEQGLAGHSGNALGYFVVAWLYLQKGQPEKAVAAFRKTVQLAPASQEAREAQAALDRLHASGQPSARSPLAMRGLALHMDCLRSGNDIDDLLARCRQMGINHIFATPYYYSRNVTYVSALLPQVRFGELTDPLATLIEKGKSWGIKIHAWYDVSSGRPDMEGSALQRHPEWAVTDWRGSQTWSLDLSKPAVQAYLKDMIVEVARKYDLAGGVTPLCR